nr:SGNH hydrolase-type esterase domain-containing protein [Tanacetum cinerariifolium]
MGEIGGNDYSFPLLAGKSVDEVRPYVPLVTDMIISTLNELIEMGAQTLVVPGNFPIGCSSSYLTTRASASEEYDPITGCLVSLNEFVEYHNDMLQKKLNMIRELHPNVNLIYADYYNAALQFYRSPNAFGFTNGALKACCGAGGPFNYNLTVRCGDESATMCDQPDTYANWDGILQLLPFSSAATFASIMCSQPLSPPLSLPSAKLMIMALEEYGYQRRRGIRVPKSVGNGGVILWCERMAREIERLTTTVLVPFSLAPYTTANAVENGTRNRAAHHSSGGAILALLVFLSFCDLVRYMCTNGTTFSRANGCPTKCGAVRFLVQLSILLTWQ